MLTPSLPGVRIYADTCLKNNQIGGIGHQTKQL
jgi:hypothetical protein